MLQVIAGKSHVNSYPHIPPARCKTPGGGRADAVPPSTCFCLLLFLPAHQFADATLSGHFMSCSFVISSGIFIDAHL